MIARKVLQGTENAVEIAQDLAPKLHLTGFSQNRDQNHLDDKDLRQGQKLKKALLSAVHRQKRMVWARAHRNWTIEDWKRVVFSGESKFNLFGSDGRDWCWKKIGKGLAPHAVKPTVKFWGRKYFS